MILVGNQRGGSKNLALHLMKEENERVEVHELRGFCADNLMGALNESYAMSRATKCKQHLFSLSLNPPKEADVSNEDFEDAIGRVEEKLGLSGQPRAIVFHEKEGRRHCHAVWSRINAEEMKAVQLSHSKTKMQTVARELYLEHGWKMPRGLTNSKESDPRNYTLAEWQQARRAGKEAPQIKAYIQDAWAISDTKTSFQHALQERGFKLARGDRRGFVAMDYKGEVYSLSRMTKIKRKELSEKLGEPDTLPSVNDTRIQIANEMLDKMAAFHKELDAQKQVDDTKAREEKQKLQAEQEAKRQALATAIKLRQGEEEKARQARIRKGLMGLLDRFTGKRTQTLKQNALEKQQAHLRDKQEQEKLQQSQLSQKQAFIEKRKSQHQQHMQDKKELQQDSQTYENLKEPSQEDRMKAFKAKRRSRQKRERPRDILIE